MTLQSVRLQIPSGTGILMPVTLTRESTGDGRFLIGNIEHFTEANRQSFETIGEAVRQMTGQWFNENVMVEFREGYQTVTGNSWDLKIALGLVSLLSGYPLKQGLTGSATIENAYTGRLGPVAGLAAKFKAAEDTGCTIFLVAATQTGIPHHSERLQVYRVANLGQAWEVATGTPSWRLKA